MSRYRNASTGLYVHIDADLAADLGPVYVPADESTDPAQGDDYDSMTVAELRVEIERRNEGREEAERIPADGLKADLIAGLTADDEQ